MGEDLQIAKTIIKQEFGKRRNEIDNSIDKLKNKCMMLERSDCHSSSIFL